MAAILCVRQDAGRDFPRPSIGQAGQAGPVRQQGLTAFPKACLAGPGLAQTGEEGGLRLVGPENYRPGNFPGAERDKILVSASGRQRPRPTPGYHGYGDGRAAARIVAALRRQPAHRGEE